MAGGHRRHHHWTGSVHCGDKAEVLRRGLFLEGRMIQVTTMMHVPLLPLLAAAADRWGRRPVLLVGVVGFVAFLLLLAASQAWDAVPMVGFDTGLSVMNYPWFALTAYLLRGITFNFGVVWAAMLFDLTSDSASRACAFALLEASNQIGEMLGSLIAGHIGHLQLLDYSGVYLCCAFLVALTIPHILANVPESIHSQSAISDNAESTSSATVPGIAVGPRSDEAQASGKTREAFLEELAE